MIEPKYPEPTNPQEKLMVEIVKCLRGLTSRLDKLEAQSKALQAEYRAHRHEFSKLSVSKSPDWPFHLHTTSGATTPPVEEVK